MKLAAESRIRALGQPGWLRALRTGVGSAAAHAQGRAAGKERENSQWN